MSGSAILVIFLPRDESKNPFEVFANLGKAGACAACQIEAITRCVSIGLRYGMPPREYVKQLSGIKCPSQVMEDGKFITSCADAISKVLAKYIPEEE